MLLLLFSHSVMSDSSHTRPPCPLPSPGVCPSSRPLHHGHGASHPLMPSSPSAFNCSQHQGLFQWVGCSHRWSKYWGFSISISPSDEYSGLISLKIGWWYIEHLQTWGTHLLVSYLFDFSYCSWDSCGRNTGVVCHSLLQWTTFCQNSSLWPVHLGWPCTAWLIASLS